MLWSPAQYERFGALRSRPFHDLMSRIVFEPASPPRGVVDLGCGNGPLTLELAQQWPDADVVGVDNSAQMLQRARELDAARKVTWIESDIATYDPAVRGAPDLLVSNAALHWVPGHLKHMERWLAQLPPGGWFAMQVPGNFDAPSHHTLRALARERFGAARAMELTREAPVGEPVAYAELLARHASHVDVWETTYVQQLDPGAQQAAPVLEWMKGTALRPVLAAFGDDTDDANAFMNELAQRLQQHYPRTPAGVWFPFRRIFAVARR